MMGDRFPISTGSGGSGSHGGVGGRGGDVNLNYNIYGPESPDTAHLMSLPRANYARHDSAREDAPSSCLEGTRVAILKDVLSWSENVNGGVPPVYWLSGLAGIGKSTIAKTVAERAEAKAMLGASFFFSRSDKPLRDPRLVFPTLAFQLAQSDNAFKNVIVEVLRQDPTVGYKELLPQVQELILKPLLKINRRRRPTLIILDALDECEERGAADILRLLFSHATQIPFLRILITSRPQPHLSTVFNTVQNLAKTVLHEIEASVVQEDIRLYLSTELAKIPEVLHLSMPAGWVTESQRELLVERSGKLFVYAATAIRFIGDDRVRDPHRHLNLILRAPSAHQTGATPYSQLDNLYLGVLRNTLSKSNRRYLRERFQVVVGSIVVLREPLPLSSLARFVQYEAQIVEATLYHLHSVIVSPSDIHEAPRIYHPSFLEFITDASRCSMKDFVIVPVPDQELRHTIRCFELMATYLKRDVAGISDPSLLNREVEGFEEKVRDALPREIQYACRYWASHLSLVELGEKRIVEALEGFLKRSILWWFEAMSLIGSVSIVASSIQEARRWVMNSKCKSILVTILSDAYRFILAHGEVIRESALHVYHSALPFTPQDTALYKLYCEEGKDSMRVLHGMESAWPRTLSTLLGHSGPVKIVAFSPNGLRLASGSTNGSMRLWDPMSGTLIAELEGHSRSITTIAFSPDGSHLISCSYTAAPQLWDGMSGAPIAKLEGHSHWFEAIAFSPDGLGLASYSRDQTLQLWDGMCGVPIAKLEGPSGQVTAAAFSPDGLRLASGFFNHPPELWDVMSGMHIARLEGHSGTVRIVAFSHDGLCLASGSDHGTVQLWDGISGVPIAKLKGHSGPIMSVSFSPNGLYLVSGSSDGAVLLWDVMSSTPTAKLEGPSEPMTLAFSPISKVDVPFTPAMTLAFSPDGLCLAGSYNNHLQLWDAMSGTPIAKLEGHPRKIRTIAFSPDGLCLVSGSDDHTLRLWDAVSGMPSTKPETHSDKVTALTFSPNGMHLASGANDGTLWLWNAMSGAPIANLRGHSHSIEMVTFSPNGLHLATGSIHGTLWLWNAMSGVPIAKLRGHSDFIGIVTFSPNGLYLASASDNGRLWLWETTSGTCIAQVVTPQSPSLLEYEIPNLTELMTIKFSPDGFHMVSILDDGTLWFWSAASHKHFILLELYASVTSVAFSPNGLHLVSAHLDGTLKLRDSMSGAHIAELRGHYGLQTITFSLDSSTLISHVDTVTLAWDLTSQPIQPIPSASPMVLEPSTPLIWSLHGQWIQVEQRRDHHVRRICYIPAHYSVSTDVIVLGEGNPSRVAIGCRDGRVVILALPRDLRALFNPG